MYPVSAAFLTAVRSSHRRTFRAVLRDGSGNILQTVFPTSGGSVSVDSRRAVRRTCSDLVLVNLTGTDYVPSTGTSPLSPLTDNEVALYRGVVIPATGVTEEVPLGVFGYEASEAADSRGGLTVTLMGLTDRSRIVTRAKWRQPYPIAQGTDLASATNQALTKCWPANPGLVSSVVVPVSANVTFTEGGDSDPWKDLTELAVAHGCVLYFDPNGFPTLTVTPTPLSSQRVVSYTDGPTAVLLDVKRTLSIADGSYNGVIVTGESTSGSGPVRAEWWQNDDPTIPPARPRPAFYTSAFLTTQAQCLSTAQSLLPRYVGATQIVSWSQVPNPAHDVWDVVGINRSSVKANADVVLDNLSVPLNASDPMTCLGRGQTVWS
jgi:hypothetical protein